MSRRSRWPVRVKRGNSTVTIYKADRKKNGHVYREFKLAYYNEIGKRTLQSFNSFKKARKASDNVNVSLMKGEVKSLILSTSFLRLSSARGEVASRAFPFAQLRKPTICSAIVIDSGTWLSCSPSKAISLRFMGAVPLATGIFCTL